MRLRDDKKRDAICKASIELINEIGFAETSMSKIAKKARISPATIYTYFENKKDLLNQLYLMVKQDISQKMVQGVDQSQSIECQFKQYWLKIYNSLLENPTYFKFIEQFLNSPLIDQMSREEASSYFHVIDKLIEKGKEEKIIKDINRRVLLSFSFFPIINLIKLNLTKEFVIDDFELEKVIDLAWNSITN